MVAATGWAAAVLLWSPSAQGAADDPTLDVRPTRAVDVRALSAGDTAEGELSVVNESSEELPVRLVLTVADRRVVPGSLLLTVVRDGATVWEGRARELRAGPELPGSLAAGEEWLLGVTVAVPAFPGVEVLGDEATDPAFPVAAPVTVAGHTVPLRVQLVCALLLLAGGLWLVLSFRRDVRRS